MGQELTAPLPSMRVTRYDDGLAVESPNRTPGFLPHVARAVGLAALYVCAAKLGLLMDAVSGFATLIWPATGIALVALMLWGPSLWPGIFVGAFIANLWTGASPLVACGIAVGNTAEALAGAWAVKRATGLREAPRRLSDVVALVGLAAIVSTALSASIGTLSLYLGRVVPSAHVLETWRAWWLGDAAGDLVIAPLLLAWLARPTTTSGKRSRRALELFALAVSLVGASLLVFRTRMAADHAFAQSYVLFPFLIWASIRFDLRVSTTATLVVSMLATWGTARGCGPFVHARLATSLFFLQVFMAVVSVTMLLLSAAISERNRAVAAREWVLAAVSHDLKNPLQMIGLSVEFLQRTLDPDKEPTRRSLANIRAGTERMSALVRDLLDYASMEAGRFSIEPRAASARSLVESAVDHTRVLAEAKSQTIHATIASNEPTVSCDAPRVIQVLVNLVDNAVKFSPKGGDINITVDDADGWVRFAVTDMGPGIAPDDAKHVFEPYWRSQRSSKTGGTGLGLVIARTIVEAHGGQIWLSARAGSGATFTFLLPSARAAERRSR
jgi:signal transduction histidine kinase